MNAETMTYMRRAFSVFAALAVIALLLCPAGIADAAEIGPVQTIYDSLSDDEKRAYDELDDAVQERRSTGSLRYLSESEGETVREAYAYDHPECFWFYDCFTLKTYPLLNVCSGFDYEEAYTESEIESMQSRISSSLSSLHVDAEAADHDRLRTIHDWLCDRIEYSSVAPHRYDLYGALIQGRAVCEGYAQAFTYLCHLYGFPCVQVTGYTYASSTEGHAWNLVYAEEDWYFVDVTWDDDERYTSGNYFMVGSETRIHGRTFATEDHMADSLYGITPATNRYVDSEDEFRIGVMVAAVAAAVVIGLVLYAYVRYRRAHPKLRSAYSPDGSRHLRRRCPNCGGRVDRTCGFCPICGTSLEKRRRRRGCCSERMMPPGCRPPVSSDALRIGF